MRRRSPISRRGRLGQRPRPAHRRWSCLSTDLTVSCSRPRSPLTGVWSPACWPWFRPITRSGPTSGFWPTGWHRWLVTSDVVGAETVPVTLAHRGNQALVDGVADVISGPPAVEAEIEGAGREALGCRSRYELVDLLSGALYIVDGHHRVAVAASERGAGFLALIVPADQLRLSSFHRVVLSARSTPGGCSKRWGGWVCEIGTGRAPYRVR